METRQDATRKRVLVAVGALVAVVALVLVAVVVARSGGDDGGSSASSTTVPAPTTSSSTSTSTTTPTTSTSVAAADVADVVFPDLTAVARFRDPVSLVQAYALQTLGFPQDMVIGPFEAADPAHGSVTVQASADGPVTTVSLRTLADGSWGILGTRTDTIRLDTPIAGTRISSPQPLLGAASAFEGHVNVMLYADGSDVPIATTFVLGRGDGQLGRFTGQLTFEVPKGAAHGVLVLSAAGGADGTTVAATSLRVAF